jgi:3-methyladenine DNA glycosylase AlkD
MTASSILDELRALGSEQTKKTWLRHGAKEPLFGVKIGDMKPIVKRIKKNYALALNLYATQNADAMYLAGLICDDKQMTIKDLTQWVEQATWATLSEYTVAWVAAESHHGWKIALQWIDRTEEHIAAAGWSTLSSWVAIKSDADLDIAALKQLLQRVETNIQQYDNRIAYTMNNFVIAVGGYVTALTDEAIRVSNAIHPVKVIMEGTACKVPSASDYIEKMKTMGKIGMKKKMAKC